MMSSSIPQGASAAILKQSEPVPEEAVAVQGPNFDEHPTLESLLGSYERIGFQANSLGKAIKIVDKMVGALLSSTNNLSPQHPAFSASLAPLRRTNHRR
jgi:deoxyhypusine synthase